MTIDSALVRAVTGPPAATPLPEHGVEFVDRRTGVTCILDTPARRPDLWRQYLDGVERAYRSWGVEEAFDRHEVETGSSTTLFCAIVDDQTGRVVAGHRMQGTYSSAAESHALIEWAGQPSLHLLVDAIDSRLDGGLIEVKSAYVGLTDERAGGVANLLSRVGLIVMALTGARYMMATAAEHVLKRWSQGGGRIDRSIPATPYPGPQYRTQVMFWDRDRLRADAEPGLWPLMLTEFHEAFGSNLQSAG